MEIYKDIEDYEGLYQVSNLGNVKSLNYRHTGKEKILKPAKDKYGYLFVALYKQGKQKTCKIHRLVAEAFLLNPNNYLEINHRDEDKTNNCVSNLEFCDRGYNVNYGTAIERSTLSRSKPVLCIETGKIYPSTKEVYRQLGFFQQHISSACNGKLKQAYGFHWKYVN